MKDAVQSLWVLERIIRGVRDEKLRISGRMILKTIQKRVMELDELRDRVRSMAAVRLTAKQKTLLAELNGIAGPVTFTAAVNMLSRKLDMPHSTVKWNLSRLREAGLIEAGTREKQNMSVMVTSTGMIALSVTDRPVP